MALTKIDTQNIEDDAITSDKISNEVSQGGGGASAATISSVSTFANNIPKITSIEVTDSDWNIIDDEYITTMGGYFIINGSNFLEGCQVIVGNRPATFVSRISSSVLRVTTPILAEKTHNIFVVNSTGHTASFVKSLRIVKGRYLWSWGYNDYGQLGHNDIITKSSPVQVSGTQWNLISIGNLSSFAIKTNGSLWVWGRGYAGMLGLNDSINRSSPVQLGALTNWNLVSTANYASSAIKSDGTLWSWGYNFAGHLGHNDTIDRSSPVQVGSSTDWSKVCVAAFSMASIKTDGTLWSWGLNSNGQLGLGDIVYRSSPTQVGSDTTWNNLPDQMKTNNSGRWMLATKANGTLWSWGQGNNGKLGLNSEIDRSSPTQVGTGTTWDKVSGGNGSSMAIKTDGTLWAWGSNAYSSLGKLGLNDTNYRSSPTQVGTDTNWSLVSVGHYSAAAIRTNGTLWSWGNNAKGELGLGDKVNKSSPTQVGSDTNWVSLSMGQKTLMAIKEV